MDIWRGYSVYTSGYQSVDRLSDIDEFEEGLRAGVRRQEKEKAGEVRRQRSEEAESGNDDAEEDEEDEEDDDAEEVEEDEEDVEDEEDEDSTPHILSSKSQSPVSRGKDGDSAGHAQIEQIDSANFNQEIESLSTSTEGMAGQIGFRSDKSYFSEFSVEEGEELLPEDHITDKQSIENKLDEQSLQRKSDTNFDVSQGKESQETKAFFGISLGRENVRIFLS